MVCSLFWKSSHLVIEILKRGKMSRYNSQDCRDGLQLKSFPNINRCPKGIWNTLLKLMIFKNIHDDGKESEGK